MNLTDKDLIILSEYAISAAEKAGKLISSKIGTEFSVENKEGGDSLASQVVTEVDLQSQNIILETLKPTYELYDLALLAEESEDDNSRFTKDYFWCIDPLDGTLPFVEGKPGFSVSIALVSKSGVPVIGIIYDPVETDLYSSIKGQGAYKNGDRYKIESNSSIFHFMTDRSFTKHELFDECMEELESIIKASGYSELRIIKHGGAAMNACWVMGSAPACYFKFPKKAEGGGSLWDYSATACILTEAGGVATDIYGKQLDLNRSDSTFMNHRGIAYASDSEIHKMITELYSRMRTKHSLI